MSTFSLSLQNLFDEDQAFIYAKNNDGSFDYSVIAGYAGSSKNLVLPSSKNGVLLKEIGNQAFRSIKIDTVVIPNGVEVIGKQAFEYCGLQSISLPSTLKTINEYAFSGNKLTSLSIPTSVTFIGRRAFNQNSLPDSEAYIYKRTSSGIDYSTIVSYGGASRSITIPAIKNGVTLKTIANASFYESNLTSVVIPDTVTSIEMLAFNNNKLLDSDAFIYKRTASGIDYSTIVSYGGANKQVNVPASKNGVALRTIDRYAFYQTYITSVTLPEGLKTINNSAFELCYLDELTIPSTVTSIGTNAFKKIFSWGNFNSFDQIINKSSTAFNWTSITGGIGNNTFVTGTITHPYGNIIVKSS